MLIITKKADIKKLGLEDQYFIDTFPDPKKEDQEVTQKMLDRRDVLQSDVNKHLEKLKDQKPVRKSKS